MTVQMIPGAVVVLVACLARPNTSTGPSNLGLVDLLRPLLAVVLRVPEALVAPVGGEIVGVTNINR